MMEKIAILLSKGKNAFSYYWKGFLVKIGLARDYISARCRRIPETETKAGCTYEIITRNERTKEERKTKAIVFSQEAMKRIHEAKKDLENSKY
jgi:hypothetical protein